MDNFEERIRARIAELTKSRDEFVLQANQQIAAMNGGIAELELLIEPDKPKTPDAPE